MLPLYHKHIKNTAASSSVSQTTGSYDSSIAPEPTVSSSLIDFSMPESVSYDISQLLHRDVFEQKKKSSLFLMQLKEE